MKGRDALREMLEVKPEARESQAPPRRSSGAIKAMNLGLQRLSDEAASARELRATLAEGEQVVLIEPAKVDASFIQDRIDGADDPAFASLKAAIELHGQQVPILVRPHSHEAGRFQAAYGHRRLRAARELGLKVRAIVRSLTDAELIVAQGQENNERLGLSFIERALFAFRLEQQKFDRATIAAALGVGLPEASRLIGVATSIPVGVITAIGPAPKAGRPRWMGFADRLNRGASARRLEAVLEAEEFRSADSDRKFELALAAITEKAKGRAETADAIKTSSGKLVGHLSATDRSLTLKSKEPRFVQFLTKRLPRLLEEFEELRVVPPPVQE